VVGESCGVYVCVYLVSGEGEVGGGAGADKVQGVVGGRGDLFGDVCYGGVEGVIGVGWLGEAVGS